MGKLKKIEEYTPEELRYQFDHMVRDITARVIQEGVNEPTKMQDIPALFEGLERYELEKPEVERDSEGDIIWRKSSIQIKTPEVVKTALWIAQQYGLVPEDTPLRQIWYSFIKLALQKSRADTQTPDQLFSKYTLDVIKNAGLWYEDFNIKNEPVAYATPEWEDEYGGKKDVQIVPNSVIAMEKESYFQYLKNFANLLGMANYSAGGMSQGTLAETVVKDLNKVFPRSDFNLYTVTDYDPAGLNISANLNDHFNLFGNRLGFSFNTERVAPKPEHYEPDELDIAKYSLPTDSSQEEQERWQQPDMIEERERYGFDEKEGMEVESLPQTLLPHQIPAGMTASDAKGQARMRMILFNRILDKSGGRDALKFGLRNLMNKHFRTNTWGAASRIVTENSGFDTLAGKVDDIWRKGNRIKGIAKGIIDGEVNEVEDEIKDWRKDTINEWIDDDDKLDELEAELRRAVVKNQDQRYLRSRIEDSYPDIPDNIKEWEIATGIKDKMTEYGEKLDDILVELDDLIDEAREHFKIEEEEEEE